jgi:hypothetical protein
MVFHLIFIGITSVLTEEVPKKYRKNTEEGNKKV